MTETELAWLAGLLEGEGCFALKNRSPSITITMTDVDIIDRVRKLMETENGSIHTPNNSKHKQSYTTYIHGPKAAQLMLVVRPYMGERRSEKIDEILKKWTGC